MQQLRAAKLSAASGILRKSRQPPPWSSHCSNGNVLNAYHRQQNRKRQRPSSKEDDQFQEAPPKDASPIHQIVADINSELVVRGLPEWLVETADKDLKRRAENRGEYDDMMNIPGSCLFLGMLTPDQFDIDA